MVNVISLNDDLLKPGLLSIEILGYVFTDTASIEILCWPITSLWSKVYETILNG